MSFYSENLVKRATKKNVSKEEAVVKCWLNNLIASHFLSFFCEEGDYYNYSILKPATSLLAFSDESHLPNTCGLISRKSSSVRKSECSASYDVHSLFPFRLKRNFFNLTSDC